jgi:sugar phosphate isomerase/epimerase
VESCQNCAAVAAQCGKTVIMEPRVDEVICSLDSLLRLMEHGQRENFKANFDTGHFSAQREAIPLALT